MSTSNRVKSYCRHRYALTLLSLVLSVLFLFVFQLSGASGRLRDFAFAINANHYVAILIYLSVFGAAFYAVMFPVGLYGGFILERVFSLSDQSFGDWLKDEAKKVFLSSAVSLMLIEALYAIVNNITSWWWLAASLFWISVSLVLARIFPILVLPLFFKYSPLSKDGLKSRALSLASKFGIKVMDVFEIDFSKKTKKANAAIIGLGASKRIVMADNLVNQFTTEEAVAVLAHEMAHHKLKHMWKLLFMGAASTTLFFFILDRISGPLAVSFGASGITDFVIFPAVYLIFILYSTIAMPIENTISRKLETDADRMALKMTGERESFISLMERLAQKNMSDPSPNAIVEFLLYNHPSISKRIAIARTINL